MSAERARRATPGAIPSCSSWPTPCRSSSAKRAPTRAGSKGSGRMSTVSWIWRRSAVAAPIADRTGRRARRERPHAQAPARLVDPDDAAAAAADRADVDARDEVLVLVHDALVARHRPPVVDEPHVEGGAAHVGGDHVLLAEDGAEVLRGEHPGHGARVEREEGPPGRLGGGDDAAP